MVVFLWHPSGYPLKEDGSRQQSSSQLGWCVLHQHGHSPWLVPCNEALVTPSEAHRRGQAAYLSLISTSSASHSEGRLSFSAPTVQTSGTQDVSCPSSVCWTWGYSRPSHSSSESEEELSSELESSLDVVSYLGVGKTGRAGVLAQCHSAAVSTHLCWCKLKHFLQRVSPPLFYSETFSIHWTQCHCQQTVIIMFTGCDEQSFWKRSLHTPVLTLCLSPKIKWLCSK